MWGLQRMVRKRVAASEPTAAAQATAEEDTPNRAQMGTNQHAYVPNQHLGQVRRNEAL